MLIRTNAVTNQSRERARIRSALPRVALELAFAVGAASCYPAFTCAPAPPCSRAATSVTQNFESDCTGPLCGFTVVSGGSPQIVGALHPGEHALEIPQGTTVEVAVPGTRIPRRTETLSITARCDVGTTLTAVEELGTEDGGSTTTTLVIPATPDWTAYTAKSARA